MKYVSTRGQAPELTFEQAMLTGLARDGGLYVPETFPTLTKDQIASFAGKPYEEVAFEVMKPFVGDTFTDEEFKEIIQRAYAGFAHDAKCPVVQLSENHFLLELFHGPTLAFKDVAMQLIGQMFEVALKRRGDRVTIVGATSGDTGSAAMEAFKGLDAVDLFIMYPHGKTCSTISISATKSNWRGSIQSTGHAFWRRWSTTLHLRFPLAHLNALCPSRCQQATLATSLRDTLRNAWDCRLIV